MSKISKPKGDRELPVTKRLLDLTTQALKGDISTLHLEMKAGFTRVDLEMKAGFTRVDAKIGDIKSEVTDVKIQLSKLQTQITKMMVLLEDQNDRNRATLDANTMVYEKIVDNDARVEKLEERVFGGKQR